MHTMLLERVREHCEPFLRVVRRDVQSTEGLVDRVVVALENGLLRGAAAE